MTNAVLYDMQQLLSKTKANEVDKQSLLMDAILLADYERPTRAQVLVSFHIIDHVMPS